MAALKHVTKLEIRDPRFAKNVMEIGNSNKKSVGSWQRQLVAVSGANLKSQISIFTAFASILKFRIFKVQTHFMNTRSYQEFAF